MLRRVALVRIDVSEELGASIIRITRIGKLRTSLVVTSNRRTLRRNTKWAQLCSGDFSWRMASSGMLRRVVLGRTIQYNTIQFPRSYCDTWNTTQECSFSYWSLQYGMQISQVNCWWFIAEDVTLLSMSDFMESKHWNAGWVYKLWSLYCSAFHPLALRSRDNDTGLYITADIGKSYRFIRPNDVQLCNETDC
jgi:hypothetical protein